MGFFALGTGFVNAANEKQKENRDERRETRKLAMEVFLKDTLPKVRAARAKDDEYVSKMNTVRADAYFKGNDPLAFYATKWMDQTGKDVNAFKEHVATTDMPPEIKERMQTELQKHFNYGEDGALSLKEAVPTVQPARKALGNDFWAANKDPNMLQAGNIDLTNRPSVPTGDGRYASVRTKGFNFDGKEVNIPTVSDDGRLLSDDEAVAQYKKTGKHLGIYKDSESAARAADALHRDQEALYSTGSSAPQGRKPNWYDRIMGAGNQAKDIQQGTETVARAAGVDPNASTTSRFEGINLPGSFETTNPQDQARAKTAYAQLVREPDRLENFLEFVQVAAEKGEQAALKIAKYIPEEQFYQKNQRRMWDETLGKSLIQNAGDFSDPTGVMRDLVAGNFSKESMIGILNSDNKRMTPEEKLIMQQRVEKMFPKNTFQATMLVQDRALFEKMMPDPAARVMFKSAVADMERESNMSADARLFEQYGNKDGANATRASMKGPSSYLPLTEEESAVAKDIAPPAADPKDAQGADAGPAPSPEALNALKAGGEGITMELKPKKVPEPEFNDLGDIAAAAPPEIVKRAAAVDPVALLKSAVEDPVNNALRMGKSKNVGEARERMIKNVTKNMAASPQIISRLEVDEDYAQTFNDIIMYNKNFFEDYSSVSAAKAAGHKALDIVLVKGNPTILPE